MTTYSPQWKEKTDQGTYAGQDMEYFQGMYPRRIKELQKYVFRQCDAMDYPGSPIYDEYPDAVMIDRTCQVICQNLPQEWQEDSRDQSVPADWTEEEQVEIYEAGDSPEEVRQQSVGQETDLIQNRLGWNPPPGPPDWGPPQSPPVGLPGWGPPPGSPGGLPGWGPPPIPSGPPPQNPPGGPPGSRPPQSPPGRPPGWGPSPVPPGPRPPQNPPGGPPPGFPGGPPSWGPPPGFPGGPPPGSPGGFPGWTPPPAPRPPQNPPAGGNSGSSWIPDIIKVLLMNELQRRRCRTGSC